MNLPHSLSAKKYLFLFIKKKKKKVSVFYYEAMNKTTRYNARWFVCKNYILWTMGMWKMIAVGESCDIFCGSHVQWPIDDAVAVSEFGKLWLRGGVDEPNGSVTRGVEFMA